MFLDLLCTLQVTTSANDHSSRYWRTYSWNAGQQNFIKNSREKLVRQLEEALKNQKPSSIRKWEILQQIGDNCTNEINSYNKNVLSTYLDLEKDKIEGIKLILLEELRNDYERRSQGFNQQDSEQKHDNINNQPKIPNVELVSNNLELEQLPENVGQQLTEGDSDVDVVQASSSTEQNVIENWDEKQNRFIKQIESSLWVVLKSEINNGQYQNYEFQDMTRILYDKVENYLLSNYNKYFLEEYLGLSKEKLEKMKLSITESLRTKWLKLSSTSVNQQPLNERPVEDSQQTLQELDGGLSQSPEVPFVKPINAPELSVNNVENPVLHTHGESYSHQTRGSNSYQSSTYHGQTTYGSYSAQKPGRLPDSTSFINTEINHQQSNPTNYFSPSLTHVIQEQHHQLPSFDNKQPPVNDMNLQDITDDIQDSTELNRVSLQHSSGQWFGQSRADAESTADQLLDVLRQKADQTQVQVVEQNLEADQVQFTDNHNVETNLNNLLPYDQKPSLVSQDQSNSNPGRLNYGTQQEIEAFEVAGNLENLQPARTQLTEGRESYNPVNSYSGIKGHKIPAKTDYKPIEEVPAMIQSIPSSSPEEVISDTHEETTLPTTTEANLPWWKRFGNKVKEGAASLKKKITG